MLLDLVSAFHNLVVVVLLGLEHLLKESTLKNGQNRSRKRPIALIFISFYVEGEDTCQIKNFVVLWQRFIGTMNDNTIGRTVLIIRR